VPDYGRDEAFQAAYVAASASRELWQQFHATFLAGNEADYQTAIARFRADEGELRASAGVSS
jgi:glutaconate CoA-transferase, subunit A